MSKIERVDREINGVFRAFDSKEAVKQTVIGGAALSKCNLLGIKIDC
jgi:hypothetical protein